MTQLARRLSVFALLVLHGVTVGAPAAEAQTALTYTGRTAQDQPIKLTVRGGNVEFSFAFATKCAGEAIVIPIESTAPLTETGAFLDDGTFASSRSTYRITGDRPSGRIRSGTVSLTSPDCDPVEAAWSARRPAVVTGGRCDDPRPSRRLALEKLTVQKTPCATARSAATRWAALCYDRQWNRGATRCTFRSGTRRWTARMKIVGPPGSGGYSRITITSGNARANFYAYARPIG